MKRLQSIHTSTVLPSLPVRSFSELKTSFFRSSDLPWFGFVPHEPTAAHILPIAMFAPKRNAIVADRLPVVRGGKWMYDGVYEAGDVVDSARPAVAGGICAASGRDRTAF